MADTTLPGLLATGDHASRPAASAVGTGALYSCTDHDLVYQSDGATWSTWATLGGTGLADQGAFTYLDATEAAAPSTPASGKVRVYAKSDGRIYSKDDAGTEYGPFDAAGAGGFSGFTVDEPPASAHAKDDEFTGSSLDAKWTNPTTSAHSACTVAVDHGVLTLTTPASGIHVAGIRQAAPVGSFTVSASIIYTATYAFDIRSGVFVGVAGAKGHVCGAMTQDGSTGYIGVSTVSNSADWSAYDGTLVITGGSGPRVVRCRINWNAGTSTLTFYYWNGNAWTSLGSRGSMSQPDQIGLCIYGNGAFGSATPSMDVDWFRVTEP